MIKRLTCLVLGHTPTSMFQLREFYLWHCSCCGVYYDDVTKHSGTVNAKGEQV
mgnify:CR=1 FL=1